MTSGKAEQLNKLLELIGGASLEGGSFPELCTAIVSRKNKEHALEFSRTDYSERLVLLPQCLRSTEKCAADERSAEYFCKKCRSCKIADIVDRVDELGCMGARVLKGGSAVSRLLEELRPRAVLGVACSFEGALGMLECERRGVIVQFVPLLRDGCADTDVVLGEVVDVMEFKQP